MRRIGPALGLFFLAPLVAEFLLGNLPITQLGALIGLAPLYGGGAVVIREVVRRQGWGYPSVVILALAYGVLEEGITTQSLFNPNYADQRLLDVGHIDALGMGGPWTLFVLALHTVWSITVPIVLVESSTRRSREPWLGKIGLSVFAALFVVGAIATTAFQLNSDQFVASPGQFAGVVVAIVLLIVLAIRVGRRTPVRSEGAVPPVWLAGFVALALGSLFMVVREIDNGWPLFAALAIVELLSAYVILRWSRREAWTQRHSLAVAGGALLTYAWHAFPEKPVLAASASADLIGNIVFCLLAVALLVNATIRCDRLSNS